MRELFANLPTQTQIAFSTMPIYVSSAANPDNDSDQQTIARQEKFLILPKGTRWKLASFETGVKIQTIGKKYGFELLRLANITRLIREYYFGEVRFEDFPKEIEQRVGVNLLTAQEITRYIKQEIIDWDPWGEYIAKLPKMPIRSIIQQYPHIADTEITAGYIELRNSDELSDPTIKNWVQDYISHLGYEKHSHMEQTEYLFHSENTKNLSSLDREKLGIILKSFDENIPLPVDEESREIVFDSMINNPEPTNPARPQPAPQPSFAKATEGKQESFIKPYNPAPAPQRQVSKPIPEPIQTAPPQNSLEPNPSYAKAPAGRPVSQPMRQTPPAPIPPAVPPEEKFHPNLVSLPNRQASQTSDTASQNGVGRETDKFFNVHASPEIPEIKVHSITERTEPRVVPQTPPWPNMAHPLPPRQTSAPPRPKYRVIDPFSHMMPEPKINGNIVDLSTNNDQ